MKRLTALLLILLAGLSLAARGEALPPESNYDGVLFGYALALGGDEEARQSDSINPEALILADEAEDPLASLGYGYLDIDENGIPELLLGRIQEEDGPGWLLEVRTLLEGQISSVAAGWERSRLYLCRDQKTGRPGFYIEGASSAAEENYSLSAYEQGRVTSAQNLVCLSGNEGETWTLDGAPIAAGEAERLLKSWRAGRINPQLQPLSLWQKRFETFGLVDSLTPRGEGLWARTFQPRREDLMLDVAVSDTGRQNGPEAEREHVLSAAITARNGTLFQRFEYSASLTPAESGLGGLAMMDDLNADGHADLLLLTGRGAYNEFYVFSLWNPEESRFDPLAQAPLWDAEARIFREAGALELCNPAVTDGGLISSVRDGWRERQLFFYRFEGPRRLSPAALFEVYGAAGGGKVGDRLLSFDGQRTRLVWDQRYKESWYDGPADAAAFRQNAALIFALGGGERMRVAHVEWVHLRERDSKQSPSLARLPAGTQVTVLQKNLADGWHLVLLPLKEQAEGAAECLTGYIWHSFLE